MARTGRRMGWRVGLVGALLAGCGSPDESGRAPDARASGAVGTCRIADVAVEPAAVLDGAVAAMGSRPGEILRFATVEARTQDFQSDRAYPPFFSSFDIQEVRYDPASGAEYRSGEFVYPRMGPGPARESAVTDTTAYLFQEGSAVPLPAFFGSASDSRNLNPWAVIEDWSGASDVESAGECRFRDEWRTVLERGGPFGRDRLLVDRETATPIALFRTEPHAVWGQRDVGYIWSNWFRLDRGRYFPATAFRTDDGDVTRERTVGEAALVERDDASLPSLPDAPAMSSDPWLKNWSAESPDTARVGPKAFLLTHWGYNEAVVAVGDTVYLLDATVSEARARQDSLWIARLFPGRRHVAVVVSDVAWPHVGGVRFWVARGATVLAHPVSAGLLREVVQREWRVEPDALQRRRDAGEEVPLRLREVGAAMELAGGALRLVPIGGVGSEGALMTWVPGADFLWAGDYVQLLDRPTLYAEEVLRAATREGIRPGRVAAQHIPLTPWREVRDANPGVAGG